MSGHGPRLMPITASRFQWHKFKDMVHEYLMIGLIPISLLIMYCNIFIGPATLEPTPEDYVPNHWEYYRVRIIGCLFCVVIEK
jgi:NADH dehydrogenase (ubiquinone) 1 beta subcomplex subunit 5